MILGIYVILATAAVISEKPKDVFRIEHSVSNGNLWTYCWYNGDIVYSINTELDEDLEQLDSVKLEHESKCFKYKEKLKTLN